MKILLTNDDGIEAPGLEALESAAAEFGEIITVAPREVCSGCGHTVNTNEPLRCEPFGEGRFAVHGSPADCVRVALLHLAPDVDWVLSGVNAGGNLGVDIFMSGTVAAAREATFLGKRAIALSKYHLAGQSSDWGSVVEATARVCRDLFEQQLANTEFWNVNFPAQLAGAATAMEMCDVEPSPLPLYARQCDKGVTVSSHYHQRPKGEQSDVDVCFGGRISVSRVSTRLGQGAT